MTIIVFWGKYIVWIVNFIKQFVSLKTKWLISISRFLKLFVIIKLAHVQKVGDFLLTARVVLFTDGRLTDFSNEDAKENEAEQHLSQSVCLTLLNIIQILHAFNVPNYLYLPWGDKGQGEAHILVLFPEKRYNLFTLISKKSF